MAPKDPGERHLQAQLAATARWSREDPRDPDGPLVRARAALEQRFLDEVDPDRTLPEPERLRRAACARKAFYQRLTLAAIKARRAKAAARKTATATAADEAAS